MMHTLVFSLVLVLAANAVIAFGIAFFWQAKAILTIFGASTWDSAFIPWKALGNPNSPQNTFGRFFAGEIFPELRRKWGKAIAYVAFSYMSLFAFGGVVQLIAPDYLKTP